MKIKKTLLFIPIILFVTGCSKFPSIDKEYKFEYDPMSDICLLNNKNTYIINGNITKYNYDSIFIIFEQKPRDSITIKYIYEGSKITFNQLNKIFKESTFYQYWIINKTSHSVFGPYNNYNYLIKRKELGVPECLKLIELK